MRWKKKYTCNVCNKKSSKKMWGEICGDCHESIGANYTSANYQLNDLSQKERMLVFMHACGIDISDMFDNTKSTPDNAHLPPESTLFDDLESVYTKPFIIGDFKTRQPRNVD
jgi:hypothetical protein